MVMLYLVRRLTHRHIGSLFIVAIACIATVTLMVSITNYRATAQTEEASSMVELLAQLSDRVRQQEGLLSTSKL